MKIAIFTMHLTACALSLQISSTLAQGLAAKRKAQGKPRSAPAPKVPWPAPWSTAACTFVLHRPALACCRLHCVAPLCTSCTPFCLKHRLCPAAP